MPSLSLMTIVPTLSATVTAVTSEASGFPIENAFDLNLETGWRATTTADQTIDVDLGSAMNVDGFGFSIRNTELDLFTLSHYVELYSDDNDNGSYSATTLHKRDMFNLNENGRPVAEYAGAFTYTGATTKRYWRIVYNKAGSLPDVIDFSGFWLGNMSTVTRSSSLPEQDDQQFFNRKMRAQGGRDFTSGINSHKVDNWTRNYLVGDADREIIRAAHEACQGSLYPLIIRVGVTTAVYLMKFDDDNLRQRMRSADWHQLKIGFNEQPWTPGGADY